MITAKIKVRYPGDWVDEIGRYDVSGLGIASTFRNRGFVGITALDSAAEEFEDVLQTIRNNGHVNDVEILERYDEDGRVLVTIATYCEYNSYTPMQVVRLEGFLPIGYSEYRDGYEYLELLAEDREDLSNALDALEFEDIEVVRIVTHYRKEIGFSLLEWQQLIESLGPHETELLHLAIEEGYYDMPSGISLEELASEAGIAKSTASRRLRTVEKQVLPTVAKYLQLYFEV